MGNLGSGINVNNEVLVSNREELASLKNKVFDISRIANTKFDLDGTIMQFLLETEIDMEAGKKDTFDACKRKIECINLEDLKVPMDHFMNKIVSVDDCAVNMLSPEKKVNILKSYVKSWTNTELATLLAYQTANFTEYTPSVEAVNITDITEEMIVALESEGYDREDMIVTFNNIGNSQYSKLNMNSNTAFDFAVMDVVNLGARQKELVKVYVKEYALFGNYCRVLPYVFDGANEYEGQSLIGGKEGFGAGHYELTTSALKYTAAPAV